MIVGPASEQDRDGARPLLELVVAKYATLQKVFADNGYSGALVGWARDKLSVDLEIVKRSDDSNTGAWVEDGQAPHTATGFKLVKWRWIVERTFGWLGRYRRLSKDYEETIESSKAWITLGFIWLLARRLATPALGPSTAGELQVSAG